jgi:hypothetical protein
MLYLIKKGFELNAVSRVLLILSAKCTGFEVNPFSNSSAPGRNYQSVLLHKVCADRESNPESPETEARIVLNIPVSRPQTNCGRRDDDVISNQKYPFLLLKFIKKALFSASVCCFDQSFPAGATPSHRRALSLYCL